MRLSAILSHKRYGVKIHKEAKYKTGFEDKIAEFEIFDELPVKTGFSWGEKSKSMAFKWNEFGGEGEDLDENQRDVVRSRITGFLNPIGIKYPGDGIIHMLGIFEGSQDQFQVVDISDLDQDLDETEVKANFVYTYDPNVAIVIRPADCNMSVIYAKNREGQDLVGFIHSSGLSVDAGIPRKAIRHLLEVEDIDIASIRIGITPGISYENYTMAEVGEIRDDETLDADGLKKIQKSKIIESNWRNDHISERVSEGDTERRHVDILGATIMQYIESGLNPNQIEAYDVDTFLSMQERRGFSHRLWEVSKEVGIPAKPGRYMVAVKLDSGKKLADDQKIRNHPKSI